MAADQALGVVGGLDAGKDLALAVADIERQGQQLVGTFNGFGLLDLRDPQIDLCEIVNADVIVFLFRFRPLACSLLTVRPCVLPGRLRRGLAVV